MRSHTVCGLLCAAWLAGCTAMPSSPPQLPESVSVPSATTIGRQIAEVALTQLGRPYQYGGNGPDTFDCSGLVRFAHARFGIETPRTTTAQFEAARPVDVTRLSPGDLLFFRIDSRAVSHVGIYAGDGRFVHAPQTGRSVETRGIDDPFYRSRLVRIGRLY